MLINQTRGESARSTAHSFDPQQATSTPPRAWPRRGSGTCSGTRRTMKRTSRRSSARRFRFGWVGGAHGGGEPCVFVMRFTHPYSVVHTAHIKGMVRGSSVGRAIVQRHPGQLAMLDPWEILAELSPTPVVRVCLCMQSCVGLPPFIPHKHFMHACKSTNNHRNDNDDHNRARSFASRPGARARWRAGSRSFWPGSGRAGPCRRCSSSTGCWGTGGARV